MIRNSINEIAVIARAAAGAGAGIGEKANENAGFQFSVSSSSAGPMEDRSVQQEKPMNKHQKMTKV